MSEYIQAHIQIKGDPSVGLNHINHTLDDLLFDDPEHREITRHAIQTCFGEIYGEGPKSVRVIFSDEYEKISEEDEENDHYKNICDNSTGDVP